MQKCVNGVVILMTTIMRTILRIKLMMVISKPRIDQPQRREQSQKSYEESGNERTETKGEETEMKTAIHRQLVASCGSAPARPLKIDELFFL